MAKVQLNRPLKYSLVNRYSATIILIALSLLRYEGNWPVKQKYFIDSHKGLAFLAILGMMAYFQQWQNPTAWIYLALHGTYGILWVIKSHIFPDKQWEEVKGGWFGLYIWTGLSLYWIAPFLITSRASVAPAWLLALCVSLYTCGIFLHFTADMQKYIELKYNPGHLITDGLLSHVRNINYFGEFLIYLGFGLLAMHWLPVVVILLFIGIIWAPNMLKKEQSLSRFPEFPQYKRKSKLFIPFLF
jgi:protein-S-isoprenylcysteine O-methyltransferase Ste14